MSKAKKTIRKIEYKARIKEILVVNDKELKPYLEIANVSPANIIQKKLGKLLGIFEIKNTNPEAAYIVNFLVSVAKKEYFANLKRSPEKSFEATLKKLNLAFSELAKHGNLSWLNNTNIAIATIAKNNLFFSNVGSAKILLFRNQNLIEISHTEEIKESRKEFQPLKTFSDISSGKLKPDDKLIFTTSDIFQFISLEEIEKKARLLDSKKFNRFLNTAIVNELMGNATLILDFKRKEIIKRKENRKKSYKIFNAFSEKTFKERGGSNKTIPKKLENSNSSKNTSKNDKSKKISEFIDKKTGHIYVKGKTPDNEKNAEKKDGKRWKNLKTNFYNYLDKTKTYFQSSEKKQNSALDKKEKYLFKTISINTFLSFLFKLNIRLNNLFKKMLKFLHLQIVQIYQKKIKLILVKKESKEKTSSQLETISNNTTNNSLSQTKDLNQTIAHHNLFKNYFSLFSKNIFLFLNFFQKLYLWPNFLRIKNSFNRFSFKQKINATLILLLIIFIPLLFNSYFSHRNYNQPNDNHEKVAGEKTFQPQFSEETSKKEFSLSEKDIYKEVPLKTFFVLPYQDNIYLVTDKKIIFLKKEPDQEKAIKKQEIIVPLSDNEKINQATFMHDLNLIFLLTDKNKLFSFSPVTLKINQPQINIPAQAHIVASGTYLTYLYLTDKHNQQIYRYPRAQGGFNDKIDWLKENMNLDNVSNMIINGDIYLLFKNGSIKKFYHGKIQNFAFQLPPQSKSLQGLYSFKENEKEYFWGWDKKNGLIIKFDDKGNWQKIYQSSYLKKAVFLYLSSKNNSNYLLTDDNHLINFSF